MMYKILISFLCGGIGFGSLLFLLYFANNNDNDLISGLCLVGALFIPVTSMIIYSYLMNNL